MGKTETNQTGRTGTKLLLVATTLFAATSLSAGRVAAQGTLSLQGYLETGGGDAYQEPVDLVVRTFDSPDGVEPIWEETLSNIPVLDGVFSIELGAEPAPPLADIFLQHDSVWVEIEVVE